MKKLILRSIVAICVLAVLVVAGGIALTLLVDPYTVYGSPLIDGLNARKPQLHKQIRRVKAVHIRDRGPSQLILGTSRSEYGLNIDHPCWDGHPFNASLPAGNVYDSMRFLEHACAAGKLERVVISLDLFAFNAHITSKLGAVDERLAIDPQGRETGWWARYLLRYGDLPLPGTWSTAWSTLWSQGDIPRYHADLRVNDASIEERIAEGQGHRWAFHESAADYMFVVYRPPPHRKYAFRTDSGDHPYDTLACFRRILELGHREGADVRLFVTPSHVWQLEVINTVGLWPMLEAWKTELVKANGEAAAARNREPFPLWDFFYPNSVTTEPVPAERNTEVRMLYFLEGSHFTKMGGRMVLDRMFPETPTGEMLPDDFGVRLTRANLLNHLEKSRIALSAWETDHSQDVAEIAALWEKAKAAEHRADVRILETAHRSGQH